MTSDPRATADYRRQIIRCVRALAVAKNDAVRDALAPGVKPLQVKMFTNGNLDKRLEKLQKQMELVVQGFDAAEFEGWIARYVKTEPLAAYDTGYSDGERFLRWVLDTFGLSAVQRDLIAAQQGRYAVEAVARSNRMAHVHFQELRSLSGPLSPGAKVHLNPIYVWGRLETNALLDAEDDAPATVMFFPDGMDIRTAVLEDDAAEMVRVLESAGPISFDEVRRRLPSVEADRLAEMCGDLAEIGLAAIV